MNDYLGPFNRLLASPRASVLVSSWIRNPWPRPVVPRSKSKPLVRHGLPVVMLLCAAALAVPNEALPAQPAGKELGQAMQRDQFVPNVVLVRFKDGRIPTTGSALSGFTDFDAAASGFEVREIVQAFPMLEFKVGQQSTSEAAKWLRGVFEVRYDAQVSPTVVAHVLGRSSDVVMAEPRAIHRTTSVGAPAAITKVEDNEVIEEQDVPDGDAPQPIVMVRFWDGGAARTGTAESGFAEFDAEASRYEVTEIARAFPQLKFKVENGTASSVTRWLWSLFEVRYEAALPPREVARAFHRSSDVDMAIARDLCSAKASEVPASVKETVTPSRSQ